MLILVYENLFDPPGAEPKGPSGSWSGACCAAGTTSLAELHRDLVAFSTSGRRLPDEDLLECLTLEYRLGGFWIASSLISYLTLLLLPVEECVAAPLSVASPVQFEAPLCRLGRLYARPLP